MTGVLYASKVTTATVNEEEVKTNRRSDNFSRTRSASFFLQGAWISGRLMSDLKESPRPFFSNRFEEV
ncbi:MAG: hypothetical protein JWR21_4449, partial [Herminiimonas sp.]|nr:hypothetical protein [Herminiimonas sp.]